MSKHTPAPWNSFNSLGEVGVRTFGAGNTIVASKPVGFAGDPEGFRVPGVAEARANFRLIDAAPDMLAALDQIAGPELFNIAVNDVEVTPERMRALLAEIYEVARNAANKAERQP